VLTSDALKKHDAAQSVERHEVKATNSAAARALYKAREPIYPKLVHGKFRALKWAILVGTLAVYYLLPWLRWTRGIGEPNQAVLVDFPGRRFYFFFVELWPNELYYLTGLLILAALLLFLVTALFGRVWCGYACPQTVWTDLYVAVERLVEGDRNKRIKLEKAPWSPEKVAKKATKHALWILIAAATGGAWVFYFHDAPTIFPQIFRGDAPPSAYLFIGVLTLATYVLAGSMREQVCTYMCPWPRIQAALTDAETLQVTYKYDRGEPRGSHKKGQAWDSRGDCVDCNACVVACPMGIDIREGAQLECINCALCIDACDETMKRIERPLSLIGYDTDQNIVRRSAGQKPTIRLIRPRTVLYSILIVLIGALMLFGLASRPTLEVNVLRDRTPPFVRLSDGSIRNAYTVKLVNKENSAREFTIHIDGSDGLTIAAVGETADHGVVTVTAAGDAVRSVRIFATLPPEGLARAKREVTIVVEDGVSGARVENRTAFMIDRGRR